MSHWIEEVQLGASVLILLALLFLALRRVIDDHFLVLYSLGLLALLGRLLFDFCLCLLGLLALSRLLFGFFGLRLTALLGRLLFCLSLRLATLLRRLLFRLDFGLGLLGLLCRLLFGFFGLRFLATALDLLFNYLSLCLLYTSPSPRD